MLILGTAGHVDHGKSSLVLALTGTDPDRLPEEKRRGMTIDLGFARLDLGDVSLGVVDVPGHERFVRNMIAGAGGVDLVLFVVAADDGWMPQSQEHLEVLKLLDVGTGVVALTKCDLVQPDWVDVVESDVRDHVRGTFLDGAEIVRTSTAIGAGLDKLRGALRAAAGRASSRRDVGKPRLPVDRAFTIAGQGTVVTGTMTDGSLSVGERVVVYPRGVEAKVRSIQRHDEPVERALAGSRAALNLSGVSLADVRRGDVVARPGEGGVGRFLDVVLRAVGGHALHHNRDYELLVGTSSLRARLICLEGDEASERDSLAHFVCVRQACVRVGDRFVVRTAADNATVGGGRVIAIACARTRRTDSARVEYLRARRDGTAVSCVGSEIALRVWVPKQRLLVHSVFSEDDVAVAARSLVDSGQALDVGVGYAHAARWDTARSAVERAVRSVHVERPELRGVDLAWLRAQLDLDESAFEALVADVARGGGFARDGDALRLAEFRPHLSDEKRPRADAMRAAIGSSEHGIAGTDAVMGAGEHDRSVFDFLVRDGEAVRLLDEYVAFRKTVEAFEGAVRAVLAGGPATTSVLRERLGLPRRLALPLLEHFDRERVTVRRGDLRTLAERA